MFETITTFISEHPYIATLMALLVFAMVVSLKSETVETADEEEEHMEDESGDEMIVCTVPGQKQIVLMPSDFTDYDAVNYDTVIEVNLKKYNTNAYLPKSYTTITPVKFHSNHNDKLQET